MLKKELFELRYDCFYENDRRAQRFFLHFYKWSWEDFFLQKTSPIENIVQKYYYCNAKNEIHPKKLRNVERFI